MTTDRPEPRDRFDPVPDDIDVPGLARERTDLAWSRSGLALTVAAAAVLKRAWVDVDGRAAVAVYLLLAVGAVAVVAAIGWTRGVTRGSIEGKPEGGRPAGERRLARMSFATILFALGALVLAVT